ncbi:CrcB protein [Geodermatophilus pulveris]|uniref:Fluoride-specific ion channel FluC n=1 Tax=Geodermatophilus pulveris TaxID=1564159 RepID=A0A239FTZ6_9ACTN|nr:CrcB family protein [Geodermatophilus pulveris]SNS60265.1 CrcB protein [Geodermatophilus pulveris]
MAYLLAAVGGALGALARWGVGTALPHSPGGWPWATLLVNLTGCLLFGALAAALTARSPEPPWARPLLAVGLLGGYTTYSAFAVEAVGLAEAGAPALAAAYVLVSLLGGPVAVAAGALAVRASAAGDGTP